MMLATVEECDTLDLDVDRRREARKDDRRVIRAFEPFSGRVVPAETVNVSPGGMCLRLDVSLTLRAGRFLTLRPLATPLLSASNPGEGRPARVVWVRPDPHDADAVLVGVQLYSAALSAAA